MSLSGVSASRGFAVLFASALTAVAFAGCLSDDGGSGTPIDTPQSVTKSEAIADYQDAMTALTDPTNGVQRFSFNGRMVEDGKTQPTIEMGALVDFDKGLVVVAMEGEGMNEQGAAGPGAFFGGGAGDGFVFAQVWKTSVFGGGTDMFAIYNESAEPPRDLGDVSDSQQGFGGDDHDGNFFTDPQAFLEIARRATEEGLATPEITTYKGKPAVKLSFNITEDEDTFLMSVMMWLNPSRVALFDATFQDPDAKEGEPKGGRFTVEIDYESDATHKYEATVERLEAMTLINQDDAQAAGAGAFGGPSSGDSSTKTWTVQPSNKAGSVPLTEVTGRVNKAQGGSDDGAPQAPLLELALEDGSAENEDIRLTFTDVDGSGSVSPGDTLKLEVLNQNDSVSNYAVGFFDEVTKTFLAPGFGLIASVLAVFAGAVALRRRR